ncbi:hypothetical protein PMAYCL1PPCAC_09298, partial [Pristionchus mayeri]
SSTMSERTRRMQQRLTITLVMQLSVPLVVQMVPMSMFGLAMINSLFTPDLMNLLLCVFLSHTT